MSARSRSTLGARAGTAFRAKATPILRDWLVLTWFTDSARLLGLRRNLWNGGIFAVTIIAAYFVGTKYPLAIAGILGMGLVYTLGRAMRVMPARRALTDALVEDTRQAAGHPRSTTSSPVPSNSRVKVTQWGPKNLPMAMDVTVSKSAPAAPPLARGTLESVLDQVGNPYTADGGGWAYSTNTKTGQLHADAIPPGDDRFHQQREIAFLRTKFTEWFRISPKQLTNNRYALEVTEWTSRDHPVDGTIPVPSAITFQFGGHSMSAQDARDKIERTCDAEYVRGLEWIYTWSEGALDIVGAESDSVAAKQKRAARWVTDLVSGQAPRGGKDAVSSTVTDWQKETHGDPWVPIAFTADFGSGAFTSTPTQRTFENAADEALATTYPGLIWVYTWTVSASTSLEAKAFPPTHLASLRKLEVKRLRGVVEDKFSGRRNDADIEITEWEPCDDEAPFAQPARIRVTFGSLDVTKPDTQDAFVSHFDGLFTTCDWSYTWRTEEGCVFLTAVPRLPNAVPFPENGAPEFEEMIRNFRDGKIYIGPQKGGGTFYWDLNKVAHGLVGGRTGAGKSVFLDIVVFLALFCSDTVDMIVCDPKRTDFTWTPEFPSVIRFAAGALEICDAVGYVRQEMDRRQTILNKRGVRNLRYLRKLYAEHPEFEKEDGPAPKRLILFFDELANFWMKSDNEDIEAMKATARTQMEELGQLARALEINMIVAAQKPDKDRMSTQLKEMCEFRLCVGPVNEYTSKQILESNHGTRFPEFGTPKGRAWATTSELGFQVVQIPYLPNSTEPCPWDPALTITGSKDRLRAQLVEHGYEQVWIPNSDGGREPRWVLTDFHAPETEESEAPLNLLKGSHPAFGYAQDQPARPPQDPHSLTDDSETSAVLTPAGPVDADAVSEDWDGGDW